VAERLMDEKLFNALMETAAPLIETDAWSRSLIYGEPGVGKTVLACDFGEDVIQVDSASGWVSLKNHPDIMKKVTRSQYKGLSQLDAMSEALIEGKLKCDTLVLDEASSMAVLDLDVVLKANTLKHADKDPDVPTQPDYGANTERFRRTMSRILSVPCHVVLLAHVREDEDKRSKRMYTRPAFTPKMRGSIIKECHLVGHMTANEIGSEGEEVEYMRRLQVHPTASITAKTRIGGLPTVVNSPNLNTIYADWLKGIAEEETSNEILPDLDGPVSESEPEYDESISLGSE